MVSFLSHPREALLRLFPNFDHYLAGMSATAFAAPGIGIAVALVTYMVRWDDQAQASGPLLPLVLGVLGSLIGWGCLALVAQWFVTIHRANPSVYRELYSRFKLLKAQMVALEAHYKQHADEGIAYAWEEACTYHARLEEAFEEKMAEPTPASQGGPSVRDWVQGIGYIYVREQLHRAEEALTLFTPMQTVLADAWLDEMRLNGSNIDNRAELITQLQNAKKVLEQSPPGTLTEQFLAREKLRRVRQTINEFRDERRLGLVQARNRLMRTVTLTGYMGFLLVALPILVQVHRDRLTAAVAFYLVGAIIGLFNRLYLDAGTEVATEDYGLATARLLHTPLFSGLAALGGALIIPLLSGMASQAMTQAPSTPAGTSVGLTLTNLLDLSDRPFGLVFAALFGLSPAVLLSRLQQEAEQYKTDLKTSAAPNNRAAVSPPPSS